MNLPIPTPIKKLESTPEIEKVRLAYKSLRKSLKGKGVPVEFTGIIKKKGVYGIKVHLTNESHAVYVPKEQEGVPVHRINIVKPKPVPAPSFVSSQSYPYNGKSFSIEKVKWSWPSKVTNKDVYRDDEYVITETKEDALESAAFLLNRPKGLTYTITVEREGQYFTYYRHSMPCLGGLVKYRDSHGEKFSMNPYFPRDIRVSFPEGNIIYIGYARPKLKDVVNTDLFQFLFSEESPWKAAFGNKETVVFGDNHFVLTNMDTDPTVFYSLMRLGGLGYHGGYAIYGGKKTNINPKAEILSSKYNNADPRRLAGQKPLKISGGTWAEGFGYTRPYNESIFKTSLPHKLDEFKTLAGYPQAGQSETYFLNEMLTKFKINQTSMKVADTQVENALVEAWDYFKKESEKLSDIP